MDKKIIIVREKKTSYHRLPPKSKKIPKRLYKFFSLYCEPYTTDNECLNKKKFDALKNKKIWLSHYTKMNDPFEYCGISSTGIDVNSEAGMMCKGLEDMKGQLFLSSFTKDLHNASMWTYYANNYKGFCVEFLVDDEKFNKPKPIIYTNSANTFSQNQYLSIIKKDKNCVKNLLDLTKRYVIKNKYWENEKEYRIFDFEENAKIRNENNNGLLKDLSEFGLKINAIYIGLNCCDKNKEELIEISKILNVKVYDMVKNEETLSFKFKEVNDE